MNRLTLDQVAGRYSLSADRFRKRRVQLEAEGFPRPLPGFGHLLWNERHLEVWEAMSQPTELRALLLRILGEPEAATEQGPADNWGDELRNRLIDMKGQAA